MMHSLLCIVAAVLGFHGFVGNAYPSNLKVSLDGEEKIGTAMKYMYKYGYFPSFCSSDTCKLKDKAEEAIIKNFQEFANLEQTGKIDAATINQMKIPRCGKSDTKFSDYENTKGGRYRRYNPQGTKWEKVLEGKPLTWRYGIPNEKSPDEGITKDLPKDVVRGILKKAMSMWSAQTNLEFVEDTVDIPDIWINFVESRHGDPFPFDGPGNTLAHAFYPEKNKALSGDMHLDDAEMFTDGSVEGRNLLWIATHELGHSLGLAHSNVREAVMYPWIPPYKGELLSLREDDIRGIQWVYGEKTKVSCLPKGITAIWRMPGDEYAVSTTSNGNYILKKDNIFRKLKLPVSKVDASFTTRLGDDTEDSIITFSGQHYFVYTKNLAFVSGPHSIHNSKDENGNGNPLQLDFKPEVKQIHAAVKWQRNGKLYLFYRSDDVGYYRRYNLDTNMFFASNEQTFWETQLRWRGLPREGPDAAVSSSILGTYFLVGNQEYKYNDTLIRVANGYPKEVGSDDFLKCTGTQ